MNAKLLSIVTVLLCFGLCAFATAAPGDYEKAIAKALTAHDKATMSFYQGVEKATTSPATAPDAVISGLVPVYQNYLDATNDLIDEILDVTAPKELKKVHRALIVANLRLADGLADQISAFKSKDEGQMKEAEKRLNAVHVAAVTDLKKQIEAAGYDFDRFTKENLLVKKG